MSATVAAARLKEAAAWANRCIANRPAAPIMSAAVIAVEDGELTVSGWDWYALTRYRDSASGDLPRTLVSGRLLADVASRLDGDVELHLDASRLHLRAGRSKSALNTMPAADYPNEPKPIPEVGILDGFGELIGRVAHAAGDPDAQPSWMHGVLLEAAGGELTAMATDRYIISHAVAAWIGADFRINIPSRRLLEVARHLGDKVTIGVGRTAGSTNGITLADDRRHASILDIDDSAANLSQYLDMGAWTHGSVDVNRDALANAISVVAPTVGDKQPIRLYIDDGVIVLKSKDQAVGESEAEADAALDGDGRAIAIAPSYLTQALDATPAETVRIRFGPSPRKPVLVHGLTDGEPDLTTRHIVMPIRVDDIR